jgi:multidrug efflux pump subunit AcrB
METALKSITGIKKMTSTAYQGGGNVLIEFQAGADLKKALDRCAQQGRHGAARTAGWMPTSRR